MDSYAPEGPDSEKATLNVYYHASVEGGAQAQTDPNEVAEVAWFDADALPRDLAFPGHVPAVLRAWLESTPRTGASAGGRAPLARQREPTV